MSKLIRQFCSVFLVLAILIQMIPLSVFAEDSAEDLLTPAATELVAEQADSVEVLSEDLSKRDEFYKEFILDNGLRLATIYPTAVHYEQDGQWADIDNTLTAKSVRGQAVYTNTAGPWEVQFPWQLSGNNAISLTKDGYTVSFAMAGELRTGGNLSASATDAAALQTVTLSNTSTAQIQPIDTAALKATAEFEETILDKLYARVQYDAVYANTNVVYDLDGSRLKESIVLRSYDAALRGYRYELDTGGLTPILKEDQSIELCDPDTGTAVMTMPAPFMLDAQDEYCDDVQVALIPKGDIYLLVYQLPAEWLAESDRAWPVILDPIISANNDRTNIQDITVAETGTESNNATTIKCGYHLTKGILRTYLRFKELPKLTSSDVIVRANVNLIKPYDSDLSAAIEVHKVTAPWQASETSWSNMPGFDTTIEDITVVQNPATYTWNITEIARCWYADTTNTLLNNTGMMFKATDAIETGGAKNWQQFCSSDFGSDRPMLTILYRATAGLESYWDTSSSSAGRAGTGYIQNYSGNLVWVHSDMGFGGNRMPVSINHVYNAGLAWETDTNASSNPFGLGNGWRTNYHQRIVALTSMDYAWEDGDGTLHEFNTTTNTISSDKDGLGLTLTVTGTGYTLTDKYGNISTFDSQGRLIRQTDNQEIPSSIVITYEDSKLTEISDGVGRKYSFTYANGLLDKITYYGTGDTALYEVEYDYVGTELTEIIYKDGKVAYFDYTDKSLLSSVTDIDGYALHYAYNTLENGKPSRVVSVTEYSAGQAGGTTTIRYAYNHTALTDHDNKKQTYFFNTWGNTISIQNSEGQGTFATYATDENPYAVPHRLREASQQQVTVSNMIQDSSFEGSTVWSSGFATVTLSEDHAHNGTHSLKSTTGNPAVTGATYAAPYAAAGESYTFSTYVMVTGGTVQLQIACGSSVVRSQTLTANIADSEEPAEPVWTRLEATVTNNTAETQELSISLFHTTTGTAYIDDVQLEMANGASRQNMIENGDFRYSITGWESSEDDEDDEDDDSVSVVSGGTAPKLTESALCIQGDTALVRYASQEVPLSGSKGDMYVLAGWAMGDALAIKGNRTFRLVLTFNNTDGTTTEVPVSFNENLYSRQWQYVARGAVATEDYSSITVRAEYAYQAGTVYFDGIQLYKEGFGTRYAYDAKGNVIQTRDNLGQETKYEFNENNDLTKIVYPTKAEVVNSEYDAWHNLLESTQYVWVEDEENTEGGTLTQTTVTTYDYDDWGNLTKTTVTYKSTDESKPDISMITESVYTSDGNHLVYTKEGADNKIIYQYNPDTSVLEWIQYPEDTEDTRTEYTYDDMFRLIKSSVTTDQGQTMYAQYSYGLDQLTQIQTATTTYGMTYGNYSLRTKVTAGGYTLATYTYTDDSNHYLASLGYGNTDKVNYTYDALGRVTREDYCENGSDTPSRTVTYCYNEAGNLASVTDSKTGLTTNFTYDPMGRLISRYQTGANMNQYLSYGYDALGRVEKVSEFYSGDTTKRTAYSYDGNSRVYKVSTGTSIEYYAYDAFDRLAASDTYHGETCILTKSAEYEMIDTENTTHRLVSWEYAALGGHGNTYHFDYDENGNITEIRDKNFDTSYAYDSANQLIREDNQHVGKTWTWEYDNAGNIICKKVYDYTTGEVGSVLDEITYLYGNESWGDLLTSYDGNTITYDTIGNPLSDGTWTYTWEQGRQLTKMQSSSATWNYTYNSDGMRIGRTNGTDTYTYWYDGNGWLLRMKYNDIVMSFSYGASGQPMSITYNGAVYYYLVNAQGDMMGLVDSSGNLVVNYLYDAWGRVIGTAGSMSTTLGRNNPLRNRGYIYDRETGLYYLQTRYYNPTWGRFINADDPGYMGIDGTPSSYNLFSYCGNNPVTRADDDGEFWHIVIGAVVGLVTQYVSDVVSNLMDGDSFLEALVPSSSLIDYGAAALSGAVGATGIGFWGSVAANAGISGGQYLANCAMEGEDMSLGGFALALGEGALSGGKGTGSKHYTKLGTQTVKRTFNASVHKGLKAGLSECGKAFAYYAKNTKTYYKNALRGLRNDLVLTSVNTVAESVLFGG